MNDAEPVYLLSPTTLDLQGRRVNELRRPVSTLKSQEMLPMRPLAQEAWDRMGCTNISSVAWSRLSKIEAVPAEAKTTCGMWRQRQRLWVSQDLRVSFFGSWQTRETIAEMLLH